MRKLKPWTPVELDYVREHTRSQTAAQIAMALGRTRRAVLVAMGRYGIRSGVKEWHDSKRAAHEYLRARCGTLSCAQMARELGVTTEAVYGMAKRMKLDMGRTRCRKAKHATWYGDIRIQWTPDEYARLEEIKKVRAGVRAAPSYMAHSLAKVLGWVA